MNTDITTDITTESETIETLIMEGNLLAQAGNHSPLCNFYIDGRPSMCNCWYGKQVKAWNNLTASIDPTLSLKEDK